MKSKSNQFNLKCPSCGRGDSLDIAATLWVRLTPDGTDADASRVGDHEWDNSSAATCECGWSGFAAYLKSDDLPMNISVYMGERNCDEWWWEDETDDADGGRVVGPFETESEAEADAREALGLND